MEGTKKPDYEQAWDIMKTVDDLLHDEEDASGQLKNTGEARGLNKMRKGLTRVIDQNATEFLKRNGFNGYGLKSPKKGRK